MSRISRHSSKTAPPVLPKVFPRERLFRRLDEALKHSVIWMAAPAGSGKTTLVAGYLTDRKIPALWYHMDPRDGDCAAFFHYLSEAAAPLQIELPRFTPEGRNELPLFTRTFFEALFTPLSGGVLVLEDYHHIPAESTLHRVIAEGVKSLPRDVRLLVTGRTEPPAGLAREILSRNLVCIDRDEFTFTPEEIGRTADVLGITLSPGEIDLLHHATGGWAAGVLLMMMGEPDADHGRSVPEGSTRKDLFDFFAEEVFSRIDPVVQDFLLRIAWFPRLTARCAEALSGFPGAEETLSRLHRHCCFTEKLAAAEPLYRFNPLFRRYLQSRAERAFTPAESARLRCRTADLLLASGDLETAVEIYRQIGDWETLIPLLEKESEGLLARGQCETVREWLQQIPEDRYRAHPRIPLHLGLSLLASDPSESLRHFRKAFEQAIAKADTALALRAWSGAVDSLLLSRNVSGGIGFWLDWLEGWKKSGEPYPSEAIEARVCSSLAGALTFLFPGNPSLEPSIYRALELSEQGGDGALRLHVLRNAAHYFLWMGKTAESVMTTEALRDLSRSPAGASSFLLPWKWLEVITCLWAEGYVEAGVESLTWFTERVRGTEPWENLALALGTWGKLLLGDIHAAGEYLRQMKSGLKAGSRQGHCHYHYFAGWYHLRRQQLPQARHHGKEALRLGTEIGMALPVLLARLALIQILLAAGEKEEAARRMRIATDGIRSSGSLILGYMARLIEARLALDDGRRQDALENLRGAFALGRTQGYTYLFAWWEPEAMVRLCTVALEAEIETEYIQTLIRRTGLTREPPPVHLESWPWHVRVHTLGRFNLLIDGEPVRFSGKIQQKPLDLLKALIALGGRDVSAQQLCDLLWPDAEGDAAQAAFATTLHRLRKLTGNDKSILLTDGKLSLDARQCWVDAWAFERLAAEAFHRWEDENPESREQAARSTRRALRLYTGDFLSADQSLWTFRIRERLKRKMTELASHLGGHLETSGKREEAVKIYLHALDTDPLAEELCRRLMICCRDLGRPASALGAFRRLQGGCSAAGVGVSSRTMEIFESLKNPEPLSPPNGK